jgi:hypothetical protein
VNDKTTWDPKGTVLLQILLQCIAQAGTFPDVIFKNGLKMAKDALEGNTLVSLT